MKIRHSAGTTSTAIFLRLDGTNSMAIGMGVCSLYYVQSLALRPLIISFGAGHIIYNINLLDNSQE